MPSILKPNVQDNDQQRVQLREDEYRSKQQINHDKRHQAHSLPLLSPGEQVWVRDQSRGGQIIGAAKQPRSYLVKTKMSTLRCNQSALIPTSLKPVGPSNNPTMVPRDQAVPVPQTPPKVSIQEQKNLPAESSTPTKPATVMPAQESHPNTENSSARLPVSGSLGPTERATRSGRVVKALHNCYTKIVTFLLCFRNRLLRVSPLKLWGEMLDQMSLHLTSCCKLE